MGGRVVTKLAIHTWISMDAAASADRTLSGFSILVTRARRQAASLVRRLEELGATVYVMPVVEIGPPPDPAAVDDVIARLPGFQWLVFTSVNGVEAFLNRLEESGHDLRAVAHVRLAAIGPKTAEALRARNLRPEFVPPDYCSESLATTLVPRVAGQRVLLARADRGRELLHEQLAAVAIVEQVAVYSQLDCVHADADILRLLHQGKIDFVTLTSANIARSFARLLDEASKQRLGRRTRLVTISPITTAAAREVGIPVAAEAAESTMEGLVEAVLKLVSREC